MNDVQHDLLTEPIFGIEGRDGRARVSLAGLLARLGRGEPTEMLALMPHQQHPWHALLVQLAALVVARTGDSHTGEARLARSESEWRDALRALAGSAEAFALVVPDLSKPAFMQPPVPEGSIAEWSPLASPDALDVLVTAKNHDVKMQRFRAPAVEHWVYALVSLQTSEGYSGKMNYGIARMNGGLSSRPCITAAPGVDLALRFGRDVGVWLGERAALLREREYDDRGLGLLWTASWDGGTSLAMSELDPFFIEICRRIRVASEQGALVVRRTTSKAARIAAKELCGATGDVWTPLKTGDGAALTVSSDGFGYKKLSELFVGSDWRRSPAQAVLPADGESPVLIARALVRGQGKTEGLHERVVPVPPGRRRFFATDAGRAEAGALATARIERVATMRNKVLKPALLAVAQGGPAKTNFDDRAADVHIAAFERQVDALFFEALFAALELDAAEATHAWDDTLLELARDVKQRAERALPLPVARRQRALAAGDRAFYGAARNQGFLRPEAEARGESNESADN